MKLTRRNLILLSGLVLLGIVAAAVVFAVARDGDSDFPRYPGRIAVRDGCGVRHMFFNGEDQRELCLPNVWAVLSVSWDGEKLAWDTGNGISIANSDGFNPLQVTLPPGANFGPSLSPDASELAFLHSPRDDGRYDLWVGSTSIDNAEQLTNTRDISAVAWSPAGGWIAFMREVSCGKPVCKQRVFLVGPTGGPASGVGPTYEAPRSPVWLPDAFE